MSSISEKQHKCLSLTNLICNHGMKRKKLFVDRLYTIQRVWWRCINIHFCLQRLMQFQRSCSESVAAGLDPNWLPLLKNYWNLFSQPRSLYTNWKASTSKFTCWLRLTEFKSRRTAQSANQDPTMSEKDASFICVCMRIWNFLPINSIHAWRICERKKKIRLRLFWPILRLWYVLWYQQWWWIYM